MPNIIIYHEGNKMGNNEEDLSLYIMSHPLRRKIVNILKRQGESYAAKIARDLDMKGKEKLINFHLNVLAEHGLVESHYGLRGGPAVDEKGHPVIVNYYRLTDKARNIIKAHNL